MQARAITGLGTPSMNPYTAIEAKYGFAIPDDYRRMEHDGFFDLKNDATYLWIHEAEWMRPDEILAFEPFPDQKPGFIPFAFTGAGDYWCWWPKEDPKAVVSLIHDEGLGHFDAPDFLGSIYRRCLQAGLEIYPDEAEVRQHYATWATRLAGYFPALWIETLRAIGAAPVIQQYMGKLPYQSLLIRQQYKDLVNRDLAFARLDEEFEWIIG